MTTWSRMTKDDNFVKNDKGTIYSRTKTLSRTTKNYFVKNDDLVKMTKNNNFIKNDDFVKNKFVKNENFVKKDKERLRR